MIKTLLVIIGILSAALAVVFKIAAYQAKKRRDAEHDFAVLADANRALMSRLETLAKETEIKHEIQEQTHKALEDLHGGDGVAHAIACLSKH